MRVKTNSLIKGLLACLLLLSCVSVHHAADDTRFTLKDGVIDDSELGLQWAPAPDRAMNHYQAEEYARNLSLAGGGWRLPTRVELKSIYNKYQIYGADPKFHLTNMFGCGGDPKLNLSYMWVWTSELDGPSYAWAFFFTIGREFSFLRNYTFSSFRVLAVRSRR